MKHYDLVLFGNEISGAWLLKKLCAKINSSANEKKRKALPQNILWIQLGDLLPPYTLPKKIAQYFSIPGENTRSVELAFPTKVLLWDQKKIDSYLSSFSLTDAEWILFDKKINRIGQSLLKAHPELSAISRGIWSYLGFSDSVSQETEIWASLLCGGLLDWDVNNDPDISAVEIYNVAKSENVKLSKGTRKLLEIQLSNQEKITTGKLVLNAELSKIASHFSMESFYSLGFSDEVFSDLSRYSLEIEFEKGAYLPYQKSCLLFSQGFSPSTQKEISLLERRANTTIQIAERRNASLYSILERFKLALRDLNRGFPGVQIKAKSFYPPLGLETCYSSEFRSEVFRALNDNKRDLYRLSQVSSETSHPAVKNISPNVRCHLPYPLGPLFEANKLLTAYN